MRSQGSFYFVESVTRGRVRCRRYQSIDAKLDTLGVGGLKQAIGAENELALVIPAEMLGLAT